MTDPNMANKLVYAGFSGPQALMLMEMFATKIAPADPADVPVIPDDSEAKTIAELRDDVNALLAALRGA